jgi:hypothetical protein
MSCPLLKAECKKSECDWYVEDTGTCAVVDIAFNLQSYGPSEIDQTEN